MIRLELDAKGRLIELQAQPKTTAEAKDAGRPFDWSALFAASGLDQARFTSAPPEHTPPVAFDALVAWVGTYAPGTNTGDRPERVHVEAAAWGGKPVYFDVSGDWHQKSEPLAKPQPVQALATLLFVSVLIGAGLIASRNLRLGRGDRRGAGRIVGFVFLFTMCTRLLTMAHVVGFWEIELFIRALSMAGFRPALVALFYLAVEPYARRNWPDSLISWNRVLAGKLRDPLVASHVLAGFAGFSATDFAMYLVNAAVSAQPERPTYLEALNSTTSFVAGLLNEVGTAPSRECCFLCS